ncbi:hypothetical protein JB92DRAFT_2824922 [Gautieria morchelliformis]|nr:hypothetical protein JB92DRAFT_2824922 [Gautieria morchelliformis]
MDASIALGTTQGTHSKFAKLKATKFIAHFNLAPKTHKDILATVGQITDHVKPWFFNHAQPLMKGRHFNKGKGMVGEGPLDADEGGLDDVVGESDDNVDKLDYVDDELGASQSKAATAPLQSKMATVTKHAIEAKDSTDKNGRGKRNELMRKILKQFTAQLNGWGWGGK